MVRKYRKTTIPFWRAPASSVGNDRCIHPPCPIAAYVFGMEQPDTSFQSDIPSFRKHPRIPVTDTETIGVPLIASGPASEVVTDIGKVLSEKVSHEGFVEPVAAAELHGMEVHREGCGLHRVPVAGQLQRPVVRQGRFGPGVQRRAACGKGVGPYGEDLRRSPAGHAPQGRQQQDRRNEYSFRFHLFCLFEDYCTAYSTIPFSDAVREKVAS